MHFRPVTSTQCVYTYTFVIYVVETSMRQKFNVVSIANVGKTIFKTRLKGLLSSKR